MARFSEPFWLFQLKFCFRNDNLNNMKLNNQYFILRHGQTIYQKKKRDFVYPWPDNPPVRLTREGKKQIENLAKKIRKFKIDYIFSSDIFRARQSAEILAKKMGKKINFDQRLRDINLGIYHGRPKEEFYRDFPRMDKKRFSKVPPKGESWNQVKKRVLSFLKEIEKKYKNKKILIVSHGDPLWLLEGAIKNLSNQELLNEILKGRYIKTGELRKL